jgi:hypothetical protein
MKLNRADNGRMHLMRCSHQSNTMMKQTSQDFSSLAFRELARPLVMVAESGLAGRSK